MDRRQSNPVFNDRKLKLGTFCTNLQGGCAISTIPGTLEITWPNTVELAKLADAMDRHDVGMLQPGRRLGPQVRQRCEAGG